MDVRPWLVTCLLAGVMGRSGALQDRPCPRIGHHMAFDERRHVFVLFGGASATRALSNQVFRLHNGRRVEVQ